MRTDHPSSVYDEFVTPRNRLAVGVLRVPSTPQTRTNSLKNGFLTLIFLQKGNNCNWIEKKLLKIIFQATAFMLQNYEILQFSVKDN